MPRLMRVEYDLHARYLLGSLVLLHLLGPLATSVGGQLGSGIVLLSYFAVLLAAAFTLGQSRRLIVAAVVLVSAPLSLGLLGLFDVVEVSDLVIGATATPILLMVARILFGHIMHDRTPTSSRLYAAGAVYMVIAHAWAAVYALVEMFDPNAFIANSAEPGEVVAWSDLLYFSLVTITTLGYGDIVPVDRFARALASFEAVTGVFFMAVVVARLITASDAGKRPENTDKAE